MPIAGVHLADTMGLFYPPVFVQHCAEKCIPLLNAKIAGKIEFLIVIHSILVPLFLKRELNGNDGHLKAYPLHTVFVSLVMGLGGCSALSIMMGRPFAWLLNEYILLSYVTSALFFCTPLGDLAFITCQKLSCILCPVVQLLNGIVRGMSVCYAIQYVKEMAQFKNNSVVFLAAVFVYMNAGSFICSMFNLHYANWRLQIPVQITEPIKYLAPSMLLGVLHLVLSERFKLTQKFVTMYVIIASVAIAFSCLLTKCLTCSKSCQWKKGRFFQREKGSNSTSSIADDDGTPRRQTRSSGRKLRQMDDD